LRFAVRPHARLEFKLRGGPKPAPAVSVVINARHRIDHFASGEVDQQRVGADPDPLEAIARLPQTEVRPVRDVVVRQEEVRGEVLAPAPVVVLPAAILRGKAVGLGPVAEERPAAEGELLPSGTTAAIAVAFPSTIPAAVSFAIPVVVTGAALEAGIVTALRLVVPLRAITALAAGKLRATLELLWLRCALRLSLELGTALELGLGGTLRPNITRLTALELCAALELRLPTLGRTVELRLAAALGHLILGPGLRLSLRLGLRLGLRRAALATTPASTVVVFVLVLRRGQDRGCQGREGRRGGDQTFHRYASLWAFAPDWSGW
jgi:hypothetical protein